jgi:hypothetical protein
MKRQEDLDLLRDALLSLPAPAAATPDCLDDETIAAFAEATLDGAPRAAALAHLATCPRCRAAVASVSRALADRTVAREVTRIERSPRYRHLRVLVPLAAAALLVLVIQPFQSTDEATSHRAPVGGAGTSPAPARPIGAVAAPRALVWRPVAGADRYRVTLFAEGGTVLFETNVEDSLAALPDSVRLATGRRYLWKVEARTGFDRWVASELAEFTVLGEPRR